MTERPGSQELRRLVREILREALDQAGARPLDSGSGTQPGNDGLATRLHRLAEGGDRMEVTIRSDAELAEVAQALARAGGNGKLAEAIAAGRLRLRLGHQRAAATQHRPSDAPDQRGKGTAQVDKGVLSEARVTELAKQNDRIVLGRAAVLTPLARDRARELNVAIERRRS